MAELTEGRGLDGVLEMSGNPKAIRDGLAALRNGGRLSLLGLPREPFPIDWSELIVSKGVTVHGIAGRRMYEHLDADGHAPAQRAARRAPRRSRT